MSTAKGLAIRCGVEIRISLLLGGKGAEAGYYEDGRESSALSSSSLTC